MALKRNRKLKMLIAHLIMINSLLFADSFESTNTKTVSAQATIELDRSCEADRPLYIDINEYGLPLYKNYAPFVITERNTLALNNRYFFNFIDKDFQFSMYINLGIIQNILELNTPGDFDYSQENLESKMNFAKDNNMLVNLPFAVKEMAKYLDYHSFTLLTAKLKEELEIMQLDNTDTYAKLLIEIENFKETKNNHNELTRVGERGWEELSDKEKEDINLLPTLEEFMNGEKAWAKLQLDILGPMLNFSEEAKQYIINNEIYIIDINNYPGPIPEGVVGLYDSELGIIAIELSGYNNLPMAAIAHEFEHVIQQMNRENIGDAFSWDSYNERVLEYAYNIAIMDPNDPNLSPEESYRIRAMGQILFGPIDGYDPYLYYSGIISNKGQIPEPEDLEDIIENIDNRQAAEIAASSKGDLAYITCN